MKKYDWKIELLPEIVKNCVNFGEVLDELQIPRQGNNTKTLRNILDEEKINYSHFTGRAREYSKPGVKNINYYLNNEGSIKSSVLKIKLIKEGLKKNKCECCGITEWNGKPLVMQLHHINGNHYDNNLSNLQILCPNCHSQTENYCGNSNITEKKYYCPDCGKEITKSAKYCSVCAHNHKVNTLSKCPNLEQFIADIIELKSFTKIGKKYGVSDNAVKKWAHKFNLPTHIKDLIEHVSKNTLEEIVNSKECLSTSSNNNKYDHSLILKLIDLQYTTKEISNYIGCSVDTVKLVGSKHKHSIRKGNIKCIKCFKNGELIKICFGASNVAKWLINELNYIQYSLSTLSDLVSSSVKKGLSLNNITFKNENLPEIDYVLKNNKEDYLQSLYYKSE